MNLKSLMQSFRSHGGRHAHNWNSANCVAYDLPISGLQHEYLKSLRLLYG